MPVRCSASVRSRFGWNVLWLLPAYLLLLAGCDQQEPLTYVQRSEVLFPGQNEPFVPEQQHAEEVAEILRKYFGTPDDPRAMAPTGQVDLQGNPILEPRLDSEYLEKGAIAFVRRCAGCHGVTGDGAGPAAIHLEPRPRDYRLGQFKFISTPRGKKPTRSDLRRIIQYGAKGTSMPAFRWLPKEELDALIDYVITLSARGELEMALMREAYLELDPEDSFDPEIVAEIVSDIYQSWDEARTQLVMPIVPEPLKTEETVLAGYRAFQTKGCAKCHGTDLKGGKALALASGGEPTYDDWGNEDYAADITSRMLHGGRRPIDIFRRIHLGINATPMPGFGEAFADDPEAMWHIVHFLTEVIDGRPVEDIAAAAGPIEAPETP